MTCAGQAPSSTPTHSHNQPFPAPCGTLGFAALPFGAQPAPALQPLHIPSWGSPSTHVEQAGGWEALTSCLRGSRVCPLGPRPPRISIQGDPQALGFQYNLNLSCKLNPTHTHTPCFSFS